MAKWDGDLPIFPKDEPAEPALSPPPPQPRPETTVYADSPADVNFVTLQQNLQNCLSIIDNEVMKNYIPALQNCEIVPCDPQTLAKYDDTFNSIQFFRITELVYQEDEFSVHKLATVFNALSNKPCTLVLMIQSDGHTNNFYLGVRSRDNSSTGTMRQMLEQSLLGMFPGSQTADYFQEALDAELSAIEQKTGCVASVTCIADYKQDKESMNDKDFIQGLEKFIYSMEGKAFTAICIANNLQHAELVKTRKEYERIYTLMSPFANMQYNYSLNQSASSTQSSTRSQSVTDSSGSTSGYSTNANRAFGTNEGINAGRSVNDTRGTSTSVGTGRTHTTGSSDGFNDSTSTTNTVGIQANFFRGISAGISAGGINVNSNSGTSMGASYSVARGESHGTSHTDSISDSISKNLTMGINSAHSVGNTIGVNRGRSTTDSFGVGTQRSENRSHGVSSSDAYTQALADTFGNTQAVTLNVQNKSLIDTLERLEKQLKRLDDCESIGMWDFAAYFLGESAAEAETAANMYRSLISGDQSGLEISAVNTWIDRATVKELSKYLLHFLHPVFRYQFKEGSVLRQTLVDATAMASTNELAIQLGLPRKSIKGLSVIKHATFAQEVLSPAAEESSQQTLSLGKINHLGRETDTDVQLDLQSLSMHTFISGSTGSGKSNTIYHILSQLPKHNVNFLVVEPAKGEYKNVFGGRQDVAVYGTNPFLGNLLQINPFSFPEGIHIYEHLDRLVEIFNVCWPMYAAMPAILKDAIERAYVQAGWDLKQSKNEYSSHLFPNFIDVLEQIETVMDQSWYSDENKGDYKGSLCTRLRSLTNGINSLVFTTDELQPAELFDQNVIVDLSRIGSAETKSLIMGILVMKLQEYRMAASQGMNNPLKHVTVLEEAHNLLKRTSTEQSSESANLLGKSVEMLTNAIAEMRTYGEGFIIADQSPCLLEMAVIRNTNTKIIMRLPEYSDRELVGRAASLNDEQIAELSKLGKGIAAVYQNDWLEPVLCKIDKYDYPETAPVLRSTAETPLAKKEAQAKHAASILVNFIAYKRLDHPLPIVYQQLIPAIESIDCSANVKRQLYALAEEFRYQGYAQIWEESHFSKQADLITNLLNLAETVQNIRKETLNMRAFNCQLNTAIAAKVETVSDDLLLTISHYILKNYSKHDQDDLPFYKEWVKDIRERIAVR